MLNVHTTLNQNTMSRDYGKVIFDYCKLLQTWEHDGQF